MGLTRRPQSAAQGTPKCCTGAVFWHMNRNRALKDPPGDLHGTFIMLHSAFILLHHVFLSSL